jgi:hypothetical protein
MHVLTFPARLAVNGGPSRRGRLRLRPGEVTWRSLWRNRVDLTGAALLSGKLQQVRHRRGDAELMLRTNRASAHLELGEAEAAATARALTGRDFPGLDPWRIRPSGRTWWAIACLTVAGLWVAFVLLLAFDGYTAQASVLRSDGGWTCTVTWHDPRGVSQRDDTDCFGESTGSTVEILVPWGDFRGAVTTRPTLAMVGTVGATPLCAVGAVRLRLVSRRRRSNAALLRLAGEATGDSAADREPASGVQRTAVALARDRRRAWAVLAVGATSVVATIGLGTVIDRADRELQEGGVTTVGTVVAVHPDRKFQTGGADVSFSAGRSPGTRYVSLGTYADDYDEGQRVDVLYDPAAPERFTIDDVSYEPPWTTWPMVVSIVGALIVGPVGVWMVRTGRAARRLLNGGPWTRVRVRVLLEEKTCTFTTLDGTHWLSSFGAHWPTPEGADPERAEVGPTDPDPADAWWVRDGEQAVFSPDQGAPLVLARMR